jgi:hypothetical protein
MERAHGGIFYGQLRAFLLKIEFFVAGDFW